MVKPIGAHLDHLVENASKYGMRTMFCNLKGMIQQCLSSNSESCSKERIGRFSGNSILVNYGKQT